MSNAGNVEVQAGTPEQERRTREAWEGYREACASVSPRDYDETEQIAWELLQHELADIAGPRGVPLTAAGSSG